MRLKTLELQGFKSFPEKTVIRFDRGITAVIGPNGSGKSNISDAMKWVLGELSSKSIRGTKMEDVIFSGSQKRSPMGYAEVSVTFDNTESEGRVQTSGDYDEITVTRRYDRTGESDYFINKKPVRLKDINELFMNTGLGKGGYSIIGQGRISEIISQKNEDRRAIFEEAAGISKYKYQKQESSKKLDSTNENLVRLEDIVSELSSRLGQLEHDSEKAKRYLELYTKKRETDISLAIYGIDSAKTEAEEAGKKLALSRHELEMTEELRSSLDSRYEAAFSELQQNKLDTEKALSDIAEATARLRDSEADIKVAENDSYHYGEQINDISSKLAEGEEACKRAEKEREIRKEQLLSADKKRAEAQKKTEEISDGLNELSAQISGIDAEMKEASEICSEAEKTMGEINVAISALSARESADAEKLAQLEKNIGDCENDIALISERINSAHKKTASYEEKIKSAESEAKKAGEAVESADKAVAGLSEKKNNIFLEISQRKHKIQNLTRMEELLEGYSGAVRFVMNGHKAGEITLKSGERARIYGPLSRLIGVDEKYSLAIETALGQSLQNIVVEDEESAKSAMSYLKRKNAGRATFYPVATMRAREMNPRDVPSKGDCGFVAVASELVSCDDKYSQIVKNLIGRILIVDNIDNAALISKRLSYGYKTVTLDGQVINAGGSFTGGSAARDSGMLSRSSQTDKLGAEIKELEGQSAEAENEEKLLIEKKKLLQKTEKDIRDSISVITALRNAEDTQLRVLESNREMLVRSKEDMTNERDGISLRAKRAYGESEDLEKRLAECGKRALTAKERIERLSSEREKLVSELDAGRNELSGARVELAREDKELEMAEFIYGSADGAYKDRRGEVLALERALGDLKNRISENDKRRAELEKLCSESGKTIDALTSARRALSVRGEEAERRVNEITARQKEATNKYTRLYGINSDNEKEYTQQNEKKDSLTAFLFDEYELTYAEAAELGTERVTEGNRHEKEIAQTKLRNQIKALGYVNVAAIEEYKREKERYDSMTSQIADLKVSGEELTRIIASLEKTMRADFAHTVAEINTHFGKVFAELFGGGTAEVKLSDPENVLESGIEINVAPPGKIIKSMTLLSGGEQAFVAIALYFAILKVNPSPFCIMDEIESALDEINVDKFADYIKKYSEKTQFVLITHRRGTMEAAERLYGVTMHEKGISDIISVDVTEIADRAGIA